MEYLTSLLTYVPDGIIHKLLEVVGVTAILASLTPKLLAWGVPAAQRAADFLVKRLLASPARPLILWKADAIINLVRTLLDAVEKIAEAFEAELEHDLLEAKRAQQGQQASKGGASDAKANPASDGGAPTSATAPTEK